MSIYRDVPSSDFKLSRISQSKYSKFENLSYMFTIIGSNFFLSLFQTEAFFILCLSFCVLVTWKVNYCLPSSQQAFVLIKTSWRRLKDVFRLCLQKTSWSRRTYSPYPYVFRRRFQDVFKTSWSRPIYSSWPYVFKTSSRRFQGVFKTFSRRLAKTFWGHL